MKLVLIDVASGATLPTTQENTAAHETAVADESVFASLGINVSVFISQLVNFLIVAGVVWFVILKPLTKKMAERQKLIDESLENARKVQDKMAKGERDYQARIDTAKVEANKIIEKAGVEAAELGEDMKAAAKADIEILTEQARRTIEAERDATIRLIKNSAADMVLAATEKMLSEKLDSTKDQKLVEEMVSKIRYAEEK